MLFPLLAWKQAWKAVEKQAWKWAGLAVLAVFLPSQLRVFWAGLAVLVLARPYQL